MLFENLLICETNIWYAFRRMHWELYLWRGRWSLNWATVPTITFEIFFENMQIIWQFSEVKTKRLKQMWSDEDQVPNSVENNNKLEIFELKLISTEIILYIQSMKVNKISIIRYQPRSAILPDTDWACPTAEEWTLLIPMIFWGVTSDRLCKTCAKVLLLLPMHAKCLNYWWYYHRTLEMLYSTKPKL